MTYFFLKTLQNIFWLVFLLPSTAAIWLMRGASEITYQVARLTSIKRSTAKNICRLFSDVNGDDLADKLLRNIAYSIFEILCTPFFRQTHMEKISRAVGRENIDLGLANMNGGLLLSMHTGNYELGGTLVASLGYKVSAVMTATDDPIFKLINNSRRSKGIKLINTLTDDMYRESLKALGQNHLVCVLVDTGALEGKYELMPFLGHTVPVAIGWLTLAQRSKCAVIPSFSKREGQELIVTFGEPLTVTADNRRAVMEKILKFYEGFIKSHPEQWAIFLSEHEVKRMLEGK
ncbi:MAG: lysophospholipid acyltransferase family protein [Candidatus Margulisbacteria bacterium]|nr:lysophospholipid acyltransferase family protein [Candidatus Margulisiibacteriota bacterium]